MMLGANRCAESADMTETVVVIDPLQGDRWQRFVEASSNGSIFHHREWLRLLSTQYGYPMRAHCVLGRDGEITAALPFAHVKSRLTGNRLVALPFSDLCPPVVRESDAGAIRQLLGSVRGLHEREGLDIEIRASVDGLDPTGAAFYQHDLALGPDVDAVRRGFSSSTRRAIAKADREGVAIVRGADRDALDAFYALHLLTRRRQGVPTQPKRFIRRFTELFDRDLGFVVMARAQDTTIAAAVFLNFKGVLTYKYGASHPDYLNKRPNNAIFMEAIRWGCEHGYVSLDLGRTDLDNEGLRGFKRGWGAAESTLAYTTLTHRQADIARAGVPGLVRWLITRTPPITGRLVGEALYGHFG